MSSLRFLLSCGNLEECIKGGLKVLAHLLRGCNPRKSPRSPVCPETKKAPENRAASVFGLLLILSYYNLEIKSQLIKYIIKLL